MFLTITMLLVACVKIASLMSFRMSTRLPDVRNLHASATRFGVRTRPSRSGSSPIASSSSRVSASILARSTFIVCSVVAMRFRAMPGAKPGSAIVADATGRTVTGFHNASRVASQRRSMEMPRPVPFTSAALASLIAANLAPIAGILLLGWSPLAILVLYFVDTLLGLGVVMLLVMVHVTGNAQGRPLAGWKDWLGALFGL